MIILNKKFKKQYKNLRKNEQKRVKERLEVFVKNPFESILNNHPLRGKYLNYYSINIGGDLRAIYRVDDKNIVTFTKIGTHSQLYF